MPLLAFQDIVPHTCKLRSPKYLQSYCGDGARNVRTKLEKLTIGERSALAKRCAVPADQPTGRSDLRIRICHCNFLCFIAASNEDILTVMTSSYAVSWRLSGTINLQRVRGGYLQKSCLFLHEICHFLCCSASHNSLLRAVTPPDVAYRTYDQKC